MANVTLVAAGVAAVLCLGATAQALRAAETPEEYTPARGDAKAAASPAKKPPLASYEERLRAASSVKVTTSILGIEINSDISVAHAKLDKLSEADKPPKEERKKDRGERKVLWQLASTDYSAVFAKTNDEGRIINMAGFLRPGKEVAFDKIGEVNKAPLRSASGIAWDVVRPNKPLVRVVAEGAEEKARTITMFIVKRGATGTRDAGEQKDDASGRKRSR